MPDSSVGAARSIAARRLSGWRLSASKVVAMFTNSDAYWRATGAIWPDVRPAWRKKLLSSVRGAERLRITGSRWRMNGTRSSIARLIDSPRPASALP